MDTKYSFNQKKEDIVFASMKDINANMKDLTAVCDSIRYKSISLAIKTLDSVIDDKQPILYRRHNKYMGARHELGGRKGRTPIKCAKIVKKVLVNAMANAENKSFFDADQIYVVHAAANKTLIAKRGPPKGALFAGGANPRPRSSNLEFTKIEIGVSLLDNKSLNKSIVSKIKFKMKEAEKEEKRRKGMKGIKSDEKKELIKKKKIITKETKPNVADVKVSELPVKEESRAIEEKKQPSIMKEMPDAKENKDNKTAQSKKDQKTTNANVNAAKKDVLTADANADAK